VSHCVSGLAACPQRLYYTRYYTEAAISTNRPPGRFGAPGLRLDTSKCFDAIRPLEEVDDAVVIAGRPSRPAAVWPARRSCRRAGPRCSGSAGKVGRGSGDWLIRRPGPRYRVSGRGGRQISRAPAARPFAGWQTSSPLPSGEAGTTGTGAVRGRTRRPTSSAAAGGRDQPSRGPRRGCRTRCARVAWALVI
jgi:hypothetical protein